jgi:hypothetical protein
MPAPVMEGNGEGPGQERTVHQPLRQRRSHLESQAEAEPLHLRGMPGQHKAGLCSSRLTR